MQIIHVNLARSFRGEEWQALNPMEDAFAMLTYAAWYRTLLGYQRKSFGWLDTEMPTLL